MSDEIDTDHNYRSEKVELLLGLKSTIEGLLSTHSINVWNTYGGLNRVCSQVEKILYHGLKSTQSDFGSKLDFWPFAHGLKVLNPVLAPSVDRISRSAEANKGYMWVQESLREHVLSMQLRTLTANHQHLHKFYTDTAFLCDKHFLEALCTCLRAVEQNKVSVLAELDLRWLHHRHSLHVTRSESRLVPRKMSETNERRASWQQETLALAPPFASPKQESILCTSDEHAVPSDLGVSSSPKETKAMAQNALRSVLRKSGSHSPTNEIPNFSFYDSVNSDPLLNMDFANEAAQYPELKQLQLGQDTSSKKKTASITRCQSELTFVDQVKVNEDVFEDIVKKKQNKKPLHRPEDVFSDSESKNHPRDEAKSTKVMKGHKRSRSDLGGINVEKGENIKKPARTSDSFVSVEFKDKEPAVCQDGYFPRPTQGQSLINYLSSQDFHTCANLDKENAHFSISEALIAAIEQMKWNHVLSPHQDNDNTEEGDSDEEILRLKQRIRIRKRERMKEKARGFPAFSDGQTETTSASASTCTPFSSSVDSVTSTDSSDSDADAEGIELTMSEDPTENESNLLKSEGLSLSLASLYSDADLQKVNKHDKMNKTLPRQSSVEVCDSSHLSAESVALSLLKRFSEKQLPKASDLEWLVPEKDAPQKLLPLPSSFPVSPDDAENAQVTKSNTIKTRLRGNMEWAPPRYQIIFNIHPAPKRTNIMAKQNFMCAGCGTRVEKGYIKRFRYCEYLGKYFCHCCHSNALSYIPGHILRKWDFRKFYVSNFSRELINRILNEPLFNLMDINPMLYRRIRVLESIQDLRKQLLYLNKFLRICKYSESLQQDIQQLSSHWYEDVNMYSLSDLINVKSGQMYNQLKNIVTSALSHIDECKYCQGFGFICELCNDAGDIIYPFQLQKVTVCQDCKSCFHRTCYVEGKCPKCARIEARRHQLEREIHSTETDDEGDE